MSSEQNLIRFNLFQSSTQYENNKNSLNNNEELALVPLTNFVRYVQSSAQQTKSDQLINSSGHSLVLQYGIYVRDGSTKTITFKTPYASGDAYQFYLRYNGDSFDPPSTSSSNRTGTSIKINTASANSEKAEWLAIGRVNGG